MMVFAPVYVAQMISLATHAFASIILTGPREQNGNLGGLKAERDKLRKIRHENQENDSGAPLANEERIKLTY